MRAVTRDDQLTDAAVSAAQAGDIEAFASLLSRYRALISTIAREYHAPGAERDDLLQEATIGLLVALRDYDPNRGIFAPFLALCVRRRLITYVKSATREKHKPLNNSLSLDAPGVQGDDSPMIESLPRPSVFPAPGEFESASVLRSLDDRCSPLERSVLAMRIVGYGAQEIALAVGVSEKATTNALFRIRVKARAVVLDATGHD